MIIKIRLLLREQIKVNSHRLLQTVKVQIHKVVAQEQLQQKAVHLHQKVVLRQQLRKKLIHRLQQHQMIIVELYM